MIRAHAADYVAARGGSITRAEQRVLAALAACRTAALGGHRELCAHCGHSRVVYNSCRNRHCPKCQAAARAKWLEARRAELLPVQYFHVVFTLPHTIAPLALANKSLVYGLLFRAAWETLREVAANAKHLVFSGPLAALAQPAAWRKLLSSAYRTEWVVYAKPPFGGPEQVLKYLARYTHRVAISNHRLLRLANGQVTFRFKNYARRSRWQTQTLSAVAFLRRFLLHLLPRGFVRIRFFGLLAARHRRTRLEQCRRLLAPSPATPHVPPGEATSHVAPDPEPLCPICRHGRLIVIEQWPRPRLSQWLTGWKPWNTS